MLKHLKKLSHCRVGAISIEYAFIAALIFLAVIIGVSSTGSENSSLYQSTADKVDDAFNP